MENKKKNVDEFRQYAENKLKNHLAELDTRYQDRPLDSEALLQDAYKEHQAIFSGQLDEKMKELVAANNNADQLKEMESIKQSYIDKLNAHKS